MKLRGTGNQHNINTINHLLIAVQSNEAVIVIYIDTIR